MPIDLSKTSTPFLPGALIASGTTAPMQVFLKPGGHGENGLLIPAETKKGRSAYLHLEFVITAGPHKGRKFWKRSTVEGDDHAAAAAITLDLLGSLARSAYNFSATDTGGKSTPSSATSIMARSTSSGSSAKLGLSGAGRTKRPARSIPIATPSSPASPKT